MAATTNRLLHLRSNLSPVLRPHQCSIQLHFSSSSDPPPITPQPDPDSDARSSFSSYFRDVRAKLQNQTPQRNPQMPRKPLSLSSRPPPPKHVSLDEIRKNLSEFRRISAAPPPSSSDLSNQPISLQELYRKNVSSKIEGSNSAWEEHRGPATGQMIQFDAIKQSIRRLRPESPSPVSRSDSSGKINDQMLKHGEKNANPVRTGGGLSFPASIYGKDKVRNLDQNNATAAATMRREFMIHYNYQDLGKKLETFRPEKKKGKWFSLQELSDRLAKLREIEDKERKTGSMGYLLKDVREGIENMMNAEREDKNKKSMQRFNILGGTPSYILSPPKEHLTQKYFHPDHMSSAEKLKLELKKVRDEFKMSELDCGSARVQVAQLTTKIKHLSNVLHKKDKHSRKGLQEMVQRRKKLLKYLRQTDWDSYTLVLSKLGQRDNPESKYRC